MIKIRWYLYGVYVSMYIYYIDAAEHTMTSSIQMHIDRENMCLERIKSWLNRPFDDDDKKEALDLYQDIAQRYSTYMQGEGEFPGELIWFSFDDPQLNYWHIKHACYEDAYDGRVRREKSLVSCCLQSDLKLNPTWSKHDTKFAQELHAWIWKTEPMQSEIQHIQSHVERFHTLCPSKTNNNVHTWCQVCRILLTNVVQNRIERRKAIIAQVINFTL